MNVNSLGTITRDTVSNLIGDRITVVPVDSILYRLRNIIEADAGRLGWAKKDGDLKLGKLAATARFSSSSVAKLGSGDRSEALLFLREAQAAAAHESEFGKATVVFSARSTEFLRAVVYKMIDEVK